MGAPQIIWLVLVVIGVTASLFLHGRVVRLSFWRHLISASIGLGLLFWGGFFG